MTTPVEPSTSSVNWKLSAQDKENYERVFSSLLVSYAAIRIEQEIGQGKTLSQYKKIMIKISGEQYKNSKRIA